MRSFHVDVLGPVLRGKEEAAAPRVELPGVGRFVEIDALGKGGGLPDNAANDDRTQQMAQGTRGFAMGGVSSS